MFTSLRQLRTILVNFIIITLVYAPAMAFMPGKSSQFAVKTISIVGNSSLMTFPSSLLPPHEEYRLLLKFRDEASLAERSEVIENYGEPELQTRQRRESVLRLKLKDKVSSASSELKRLDKVVEWVEPDYIVKNERKIGSPLLPLNLRSCVPMAWNPKLPIVAIIDTGLSGKSELGWNFLNDSKNATDDNGHGSEMARLVTEVNPKVMLMPLKALDANGIGTVSKIAAAIDYATNHHAGVILLSFGTGESSNLIEEARTRAEMAGVVIIAAAGNDAVDLAISPQYPAATKASNLITVAATTKNNELADYSNFGQGVHVAALGDGANASRGTSMAAARVAGIASLLKAERPWVSVGAIKN
jgi:hypothetical protein